MTKVIIKRVTTKLDFFQPCKQAVFRAGYGTNVQLQTIQTLIERTIQYNKTLMLILVDFEKAIDYINQNSMLSALKEYKIDHPYTYLKKYN